MSGTSDGAQTLGRWPGDRARLCPERVAIVDRGVELTYGDLDRRAGALARAWREAGYRRGDRVATLVGNGADHVVAFFACARAGLVLVPLSWRLTPLELAEQLSTVEVLARVDVLCLDKTGTITTGDIRFTALHTA